MEEGKRKKVKRKRKAQGNRSKRKITVKIGENNGEKGESEV
jgi:hypothetical protein